MFQILLIFQLTKVMGNLNNKKVLISFKIKNKNKNSKSIKNNTKFPCIKNKIKPHKLDRH